VAVHASGCGFTDPLTVLAYHLLRLVKVFEIGTTDQAAGGRGHVESIGQERDKGSDIWL
jgi:hypothetical protein